MDNAMFPRGCDSARVIQVIETKSARGSGTAEQPTRIVTEYWSLDGEKLAERDPSAAPLNESEVIDGIMRALDASCNSHDIKLC